MKLPQFSLRDLFWLLLVYGLVLGWTLDHTALKRSHEREIKFLRRDLQR